MFELAVPAAVEFKSPRACAFALLGLQEYLDSFPGDRAALSASDVAGESTVEFVSLQSIRPTGIGLKTALHTPTRDCRRL